MSYNLKTIGEFLKNGGDVNHVDVNGQTMLSSVIMDGRKNSSVRLLVNNGANVNYRTSNGRSVVSHVIDIDILELLVKHGVDLKDVDSKGNSYIAYATDTACIEYAQSVGVSIHAKNREGKTALHFKFERYGLKHIVTNPIVDYFIAAGVDIDERDPSGKSVVHTTECSGINYLAFVGADFQAVDNMGRSCLHSAITRLRYIHGSTVLKYIAAGVDINTRDNEGKTPLHLSQAYVGSDNLIQHGADRNAVDNKGRTVLHYAFKELMRRMKSLSVTEVGINITTLIRASVDINILDNDGVHCMDEFLSVIHRYQTSSVKGSRYLLILRFAILHGLDMDRHGPVLYRLVTDPKKSPEMYESIVASVKKWHSIYMRYNMMLMREALFLLELSELSEQSKKAKTMGVGCSLLTRACALDDDLFRHMVEFL